MRKIVLLICMMMVSAVCFGSSVQTISDDKAIALTRKICEKGEYSIGEMSGIPRIDMTFNSSANKGDKKNVFASIYYQFTSKTIIISIDKTNVLSLQRNDDPDLYDKILEIILANEKSKNWDLTVPSVDKDIQKILEN